MICENSRTDIYPTNKMVKIAKRNQNLDQNPNLKPQKKPWTDPIDFPTTTNISNDYNTLKTNELLIWKGQPLSQDYLRTIDENQRDEIAKDVYNFWLEYPFDRTPFDEKEVQRAWKSLCKLETKIEIKNGVTYINNSSTSGNQIYRNFFPNIIKIKGVERPSIYDNLKDSKKLWQIVRNRIGNTLLWNDDPAGIPVQYPMPQTLSQIIIGAKNSGLSSMGSIFKCAVAKTIYSKYIQDGFKVLDYSAGFGGRLLGLMALQKENISYYGYEPNTETYENLLRMIDYFGFEAHIKKVGSEIEIFNEKFDFIFSSPPYYSLEKYSEESTQCYNAYPVYEEWLEKYWRATVQNIKHMSKPETVFGINVGGEANSFVKKLEIDMNRIIVEEGWQLIDTWYMQTSRSHLSDKRNKDSKTKLEGVFFYKQ